MYDCFGCSEIGAHAEEVVGKLLDGGLAEETVE